MKIVKNWQVKLDTDQWPPNDQTKAEKMKDTDHWQPDCRFSFAGFYGRAAGKWKVELY